jgi:hypothetical protein
MSSAVGWSLRAWAIALVHRVSGGAHVNASMSESTPLLKGRPRRSMSPSV